MGDRYRAAARAYFCYGIVYLVGGLYLVSQGVGVMGARTAEASARTMLSWGLLGLIPLVVIPWLLSRPWSWLGGLVSRTVLAWIVTVLLAYRAYKVGQIALRGGASVAAPWGGEIGFQAGAFAFLIVTLVALGFVLRAVLQRPPAIP